MEKYGRKGSSFIFMWYNIDMHGTDMQGSWKTAVKGFFEKVIVVRVVTLKRHGSCGDVHFSVGPHISIPISNCK